VRSTSRPPFITSETSSMAEMSASGSPSTTMMSAILPTSSVPSSGKRRMARAGFTVARRMARDFGITRGVDLVFASDLPYAAGLSSSTALSIGVFFALGAANRLPEHPRFRAHLAGPADLAEYLGCLENGRPFGPFEAAAGVGTLGGCEDQAAILMASPGELAQFRFLPVRLERRVAFPGDYVLVIGASGVVAEKTGAAMESYNAAARTAAEIDRRWRATGARDLSLGAALTRSRETLPGLRGRLAGEPALRARLEQFAEETEELVPAAAAALCAGGLEAFGRLVDRSQAGAERGLGNQIPETIHLQRAARRLGAVAASAFGAGFGGLNGRGGFGGRRGLGLGGLVALATEESRHTGR